MAPLSPLHHTNFRVIAPRCALKAWYDGATVVLTSRTFDPVKFLDAMEEEGMSELVLLPAQLHAVAATPGFELRNKSSVRLIMSGGDIVTSSLIAESKRLFPGAGFMTAWGMSEAGGCFAWPYWDNIKSIPFYSGITPLGRVTPGSRIRLISEDGKVVQRGESGELRIQSNSVFKSYLAAPEKMAVVYTDEEGRWSKTGDLGMINDAGDVWIVGRLKDVIKRAAISIAPAAIESCLAAFTGSQTAVVGRPHPTLGREPFAILQSFNGKSESDLSAHVIAMYGPDWVLGGAIELKTLGLETFPTNATGKINKLDLVAALAESSAVVS